MNFKPGDKVWIVNTSGQFPVGTYAGVLIGVTFGEGWWDVDIEGIPAPPGDSTQAHESQFRRRDDPPPQQEPQREATGEWDLCPWRPVSVRKEDVA